MGDDLPRQLYEAFMNAHREQQGLAPEPPMTPDAWYAMEADMRQPWEAVADAARRIVSDRFADDMKDAAAEMGAEAAIANLVEDRNERRSS